MNPLSSLNSAASRTAQASQALAARSNAADAQATLANRLAEKLGVPPGSLSGSRDEYTPEKVAGRILGFIEQRLQSEAAAGADPAKLDKLLSQARDGVEKGFAEARKILDGMGVLKGQVASDIDDTYKRIQDGFGDLDKRFGSAAPGASDNVAVAGYSERFSALAETFDLSVTTRDGDRLRISVAQASASWSQSSFAASSDGKATTVVGSNQSGSLRIGGWQVDVEGELDDDEIKALEKLFSQVQDLSDKFYAGDLAGAFDRAMALDMDGEQLASMSLRLTQTSVRQATDAYGAVAGQGASAVNAGLQEYAQGLLDALRSAGDLAQDAGGMLKELLKGGFSLDERFDLPRLEKADSLNRSLLDGLQSLLAGQAGNKGADAS
ncbi:DUF5610 domain-containing protein [Ectopseudomonas toyotomiensis]|uniref:DUF5610 domain-containing protein n=1 Tax=Ectopseudomonas toyotomiensis TaxID=554344 RepID=A0AA42IHF2_9GAMM|nr:DUF5610 domain-containing protein [Pseudomonas toyotomiensis]MBG0838982.1 DUF5610 domain-containing protein [Pseudomonas toyotomiensis]MDH0699942.1 DUF5610 domain-containing protein [Pseudomonas toyotomiensis]QSL91930.1 DUF5610 domain-containing protein [Pseudomonas toyotomiensis]